VRTKAPAGAARQRSAGSARHQRTGSGLHFGSARERDEERDKSSGQRDRGGEREEFQNHVVGHEPTLLTEGRAEPLHLRPIRVGHRRPTCRHAVPRLLTLCVLANNLHYGRAIQSPKPRRSPSTKPRRRRVPATAGAAPQEQMRNARAGSSKCRESNQYSDWSTSLVP
jgi:hypothetical protein